MIAWMMAVIWILTLVLLLAAAYRALFSTAYLFFSSERSRSHSASPPASFAILIPAHDEELLIGEVIRSIRAARYDQARLEIHVIADNCSDGTADRVRALGENVHERNDPEHPGKGQAIDWMLSSLEFSRFDAVAFFDADNLVDPEFFAGMDRELAAGHDCLQGYYDIANPGESIVTRLLTVTYVMKNLLFNAGKSRLGLSVFLMGTGMVFRSRILERTGWQAMSIGEDLEQTFCLLEAGERIYFVADAIARAQEVTSLGQGYTQRQRWASGRRALNGKARAAIVEGIRHGSWIWIDAGVELLMPSYSKLLTWTAATGVACIAISPWSIGPLVVVALVAVYQIVEVAVALRIMRAAPEFVLSLAFAPVFLIWKAGIDLLALIGHRKDRWTRTDRQPHLAPATADSDPVATARHTDP